MITPWHFLILIHFTLLIKWICVLDSSMEFDVACIAMPYLQWKIYHISISYMFYSICSWFDLWGEEETNWNQRAWCQLAFKSFDGSILVLLFVAIFRASRHFLEYSSDQVFGTLWKWFFQVMMSFTLCFIILRCWSCVHFWFHALLTKSFDVFWVLWC